jgi:hypothetical protein
LVGVGVYVDDTVIDEGELGTGDEMSLELIEILNF